MFLNAKMVTLIIQVYVNNVSIFHSVKLVLLDKKINVQAAWMGYIFTKTFVIKIAH